MNKLLDSNRFPLHCRRLIEANAGTGKTFTITTLYVRLILGHGTEKSAYPRNLMPYEILVVTFTNTTSIELKNRIRARLIYARDVLLGNTPPDSIFKNLFIFLNSKISSLYVIRLDKAIRIMDSAAILTIHGFCYNVLKRYALHIPKVFNPVINTVKITEQQVQDYWRRYLYPLPKESQKIIQKHCKTPLKLFNMLIPLISNKKFIWKGNLIKTPSSIDEILEYAIVNKEYFIKCINKIKSYNAHKAIECLSIAIDNKILNLRKFNLVTFKEKSTILIQWMAGDYLDLPSSLRLQTGQPWFSQLRIKTATKKKFNTPTNPIFTAFDIFFELEKKQSYLLPKLLAHARYVIKKNIIHNKQTIGLCEFDELLNNLYEALHKSNIPIANSLRQEFPITMIDEFQDTNQVQFSIFNKIYPLFKIATNSKYNKFYSLIMIGDPKQAIYGFRDADIYTYIIARDTIDTCYTLSRNFRSTIHMVEAVNWLFCNVQNPFINKKILFNISKANGIKSQLLLYGKPITAINLWLPKSNANISTRKYIKIMSTTTINHIKYIIERSKKKEAGFIIDNNISTLKPIKLSDIAILVRTGLEAIRIQYALSQYCINSIYINKSSIFSTKEAFWLIKILEAAVHPYNYNIIKSALATRLLSDSLEKFTILIENELIWEKIVDRFEQYHCDWQNFGLLTMIKRIIHDFDVNNRLLRRKEGMRSLNNIFHLIEIAQNVSNKFYNHNALLRWFYGGLANNFPEGMDPESLIQRFLEIDNSLIRIVTIHNSKGLEYPIVYMPFICNYYKIKNSIVNLNKHHYFGNVTIMNPNSDDLIFAETARLEEDLRLLYVGLTRAIYTCYLGIAPLYKNNSALCTIFNTHTLNYSILYNQILSISDKIIKIKIINPTKALEEKKIMLKEKFHLNLQNRYFNGNIDLSLGINSYTSLTNNLKHVLSQHNFINKEKVSILKKTTQFKYINEFPSGLIYGSFLHSILKKINFDNINFGKVKCLYEYKNELEKIISLKLMHSGYDKEWKNILLDWIFNIFNTPMISYIPIPNIVKFYKIEKWQVELEFFISNSYFSTTILDSLIREYEIFNEPYSEILPCKIKGMLCGYIDLVFKNKGRWYLLDWKSNYLGKSYEDYNKNALLKSIIVHRYDIQYVIYTLALHRLLRLRIPKYDYNKDMGGVFYVFIRGFFNKININNKSIYYCRPSIDLINKLDKLFSTN
ncbi:Exodeoxyribonuclease V beta chain [Candidatus Johnevansia muelleri]|uniref:RecBCD enzyme subunit RecB n=1 Tax=Candidatus Johnevansia muelleri TaxID=1495769 RepID=A0A078KE37_9GAMM|nr:Exodeoxyribonuclease V beta chain [Candidatus Evansia muelleri]